MPRSLILLLFLLAGLLRLPASAATLDLRFLPGHGAVSDPAYPGISTVSTGASTQPGWVPTLSGRGYGLAVASSVRWGIVDGIPVDLPLRPGWTVSGGFEADAIGSMISTDKKVETDASYLSIRLAGVAAGTVFTDISLTLKDFDSLKYSKSWAGTSADGFASATKLKLDNNKGVKDLTVTLPEFTYSGPEPLEIRIYGVTGSDTGSFRAVSVTGTVTGPVTIPEPDIRLLVTTVGLAGLVAFRRRRGSLPG